MNDFVFYFVNADDGLEILTVIISVVLFIICVTSKFQRGYTWGISSPVEQEINSQCHYLCVSHHWNKCSIHI